MCKYGTDKYIIVIHQNRVVPLDACIAPLVYLLNEFGIETIACCCHHGQARISSIIISSKNIRICRVDDGFSVHLEFPYKEGK